MKVKRIKEGKTLLGKTFKALAEYYNDKFTVVKSDGKLVKVATPGKILDKIGDVDLVRVEIVGGKPTIVHKKN